MNGQACRWGWIAGLALGAAWVLGCGPKIPEGRYACDPGDPGSCPAGWYCRPTGPSTGSCYETPGDGGADVEADVDADVEDGLDDGDGGEGTTCDPATCDDGNLCNGEEVCTADDRCVATRPPEPGTECTTPLGVPGFCQLEQCRPETCGDGVVDSGEDCDDGNLLAGDGCEPHCVFSCRLSEECDDGEECNGEERCTGHACAPGTPLANGTACGDGLICLRGACVAGGCGDGTVAGDEQCDDANDLDGDGCDGDCTFSCEASPDCDDLLLCNGGETCDAERHVCDAGTPAGDGTPCTPPDGASGTCRGGLCAPETCGNGSVNAGEECDDDNLVPDDGCEADCTWTCETAAECDDARVCNGTESCDTGPHTCDAGLPPDDGTACDRDGDPLTRDICLAEVCTLSSCGDRWVDGARGEQCDDANTTTGDGCEADCTFTCETDPECDDDDECSGTETCNTGTHVCRPGTPLGDDTTCTTAGGAVGRCRSGTCAREGCGDGTLDVGEECDDGDVLPGDGCEADCTYSCHAAADCHETPDNPCTDDTCSLATNGQACVRTANTVPCDDDDLCTSGDACAAGTCAGLTIDGDGDTYGPGAECGGDCNDALAGVNPGASETCNGVDDDCSGTTDDGVGMTCSSGSSRACVTTGPGGSCAGTEACTSACVWSGSCELAAVESCNGSDDDCDGTTDEGFDCVFGRSESCADPCGGSAGTRTCGSLCGWGPCMTAEAACNGCDDDADGLTDEGFWCPLSPAPTTADLFAVDGRSAVEAWAVGDGVILRWNGTAWSTMTGGAGRLLRGVWTGPAGNAWAVGDGGTILRWDDSAWTAETSGTTIRLEGVWGTSTADVWAVGLISGTSGLVLHRDATGVWTRSSPGVRRDFHGVWGTAVDNVYAVAHQGVVRRWNGTTWADAVSGTNVDLYAVDGSSSGDVWVVGETGMARRWNGTTWTAAATGTTQVLRATWAASATLAWAVGDNGTILRWNGTAWAASPGGGTTRLNGVWGASAGEVWAVGAGGTILRRRE
jgi:cysteine-rich repeat protein